LSSSEKFWAPALRLSLPGAFFVAFFVASGVGFGVGFGSRRHRDRGLNRGVQTGGFSPGFGGKTSRSFGSKTQRKNPCVETSPEEVRLFFRKVSRVSL
jgi:hypothetical protein